MKLNDKFEIVKNKIARNRIVMPPMDTSMASEDGRANDFHLQHYASRAWGGVGTIIIESTAVSEEGIIRTGDLQLWNNSQRDSFIPIIKQVKKANALIGIQLNHAGSKAEINFDKLGATKYYDYLDQRNLKLCNRLDLKNLEDKFVQSARLAKEAGFDFIEIHAAHGYFISTLISKKLNDIIDGDILKRSQMLINICERINKDIKIGLGVRFSVNDHDQNGITIQDFKPLVKELDQYVDYYHISSGVTLNNKPGDLSKGKLFRIPYGVEFKKFTNKNIIVVGNFNDRQDGDRAIVENNLDGVAYGRELIFNPNLVINKLLKSDELNQSDYHWNNNSWYDPISYLKLIEKLSK